MLRPYSKLATFLALLTPAIASAQTEPALWRFVHPDAKALMSLDWRRVGHSHIGAMLREKFLNGNAGPAMPGIELLDDIDRFVISSPGRKSPDDPEAPLLVAVGGHFDLAKVRKLLTSHGAKPQAFNSFQVYRPQGKNAKDLAVVLLDAQTLLVGDSRSIFASLERNAFTPPTPEANSILSRAAAMEANYDAWAIITSPDALASDRLTGLLTGGELGAQARGFELGFSLRNGLAAEFAIMFDTEAAAKRMSSELSKMVKLAVKDKMGEPAMLDLEKKFKFSAEGNAVRVSMRLTQQELEKNAKVFAESRKRSTADLARVRPLMTPIVPVKPENKMIRIEGLDEGIREIPIKQP